MKTQTKEVISNVHVYFMKLYIKGKSQAPLKRTIKATGIGETTVRSILKEKDEKGKFKSLTKRYRRSRKEVTEDYEKKNF